MRRWTSRRWSAAQRTATSSCPTSAAASATVRCGLTRPPAARWHQAASWAPAVRRGTSSLRGLADGSTTYPRQGCYGSCVRAPQSDIRSVVRKDRNVSVGWWLGDLFLPDPERGFDNIPFLVVASPK